MRRQDFAIALAQRNEGINLAGAIKIVNDVVDILAQAIAKGENIYLRGIGSMMQCRAPQRTAHDFATGRSISVPSKRTLRFKLSKELKNRMNRAANAAN